MTNSERYLDSSFKASKSLTKTYSTSFSMGIFYLGKDIRNAIFAIYGFVRVADEIVDTFFEIDQSDKLDKFHQSTIESITFSDINYI